MTPKLSTRANKALEILRNGGVMVERLERNSYTGREQFQTRFQINGHTVKGLGVKTRHELEGAGIALQISNSTSVSTRWKLAA